MGPIQLIIVIAAVIILNNYVWKKGKEKTSILGMIFQIAAIVIIILVLEHFIPFLK